MLDRGVSCRDANFRFTARQGTRFIALRKGAGFTLIELIIVVVILGIIVAVGTTKYLDMKQQAAATGAVAIMRSLSASDNVLFARQLMYGTAYDEASIIAFANMSSGAQATLSGSSGTVTIPGWTGTFTLTYTAHDESHAGQYERNGW